MTAQFSQLFWENLIVTVPAKDDEWSRGLLCKFSRRKPVRVLNILKEVSGYAETGNMFAILGPSGAGKTTFLAALARRLELTSGAVKINGHDVSRETMAAISSYMSQFDVLPSALTPREHMSFMCALKIGNSCSVLQRKSLGEELLRDLRLCECIDTAISKLSGGEKKRLSLAVELVTRPKILFLDEPTTGLDAFSATCVMQSLKLIASKSTMIFCTIHQPGMAIYNMFSHVILMADGRSIYFGTLKNATEFFESQDYQCPTNYDESEYYVNILSRRNRADRNIELYEAFSQSSLSKIPAVENIPIFHASPRKKSGWFVQFYWLLWRIFLRDKRTAFDNWIAWFSCAVLYLISRQLNELNWSELSLERDVLRNIRQKCKNDLVAVHRFRKYFLRRHRLVNAGRDTKCSGCAVLDDLRGNLYDRLFRRLRATWRACSLHARKYSIRIGTLLPRYRSRPDTQGNIQDAFIHGCTIHCTVFRIFAARLLLLLPLHDGDGDLQHRVRHDDLQLDRRHRYRDHDNDTTRPAVSLNGRYVLQSADSTELFGVSQIFLRVLLRHRSYIDSILVEDREHCRDLPCLSNGTEVLLEYGYNEGNFWWDMTGLLLLTILMNITAYIGTKRRALKSIVY